MKTNTEQNHAQQCAMGHAEEIVKLHAELLAAEEQQERESLREAIITQVLEMPLSVDVRSGWHAVGQELEAHEFQIMLATGGSAVRIFGELGSDFEPENVTICIQFQDHSTPWTNVDAMRAVPYDLKNHAALVWFAQQFVYSGD